MKRQPSYHLEFKDPQIHPNATRSAGPLCLTLYTQPSHHPVVQLRLIIVMVTACPHDI